MPSKGLIAMIACSCLLFLIGGVSWAQDIPEKTVQDLVEEYTHILAPEVPAGSPSRLILETGTAALLSPTGDILVRTMPSSWDHITGVVTPYAWPGRDFPIWGNVTGYSGSCTYEWDFGDGSASVSGAVSNPNYIYAYHSYSTIGTYYARLIVTDATSESDTSTVRIDVALVDQQIRVNAAIEDGLRYLYLRQATDGGWGSSYRGAATASAVSAFEIHGHFPSNPVTEDIYAERVKMGLGYICASLTTHAIGGQAHGNPDSNGNGIGVRPSTDNAYVYSHGLMMFAIASSRCPDSTATRGPSGVIGRKYKDILTDMVDQLAWCQTEGYGRGGWRYLTSSADYGSSDNSIVQWASIGLKAAEMEPWFISAPAFVKSELAIWLTFSQCGDGGFAYTSCSDGYASNVGRTGSGIYSYYYLGAGPGDSHVVAALNYLCNHWCSGNCGASAGSGQFQGCLYGMYAVKKALEDMDIPVVCGHDWKDEYRKHLVKGLTSPCPYNTYHQITDTSNPTTDGRWDSGQLFGYGNEIATSFALLILIPGVHPCTPVAVASINPPSACPNTEICFDGSGSYLAGSCTNEEIIEWKWDLGDGQGFRYGQHVCKTEGYPLPPGDTRHDYSITLTVTASNNSSSSVTETLQIGSENHAPIAVCGGPYTACVGEPINLNGCASYDPDHDCTGDSIVEYCWNFEPPGGDWFCWPTCIPDTVLIFNSEIVRTIQLRVRDTHGLYSDPNGGTVEVWSSYKELSVLPGDIVFTPNESCDTVEICATIHAVTQRPDITIESAVVDFYVDDPTDPANRLGRFNTPVMRNGDVATFCLRWIPPADSLDIYVVVDPNQLIRECNERDNLAVKKFIRDEVCAPCDPLHPPVLSLVGYRTVSWVPPLWTVQVEVRNAGPGVAMNVSVVMNEELPWLTIPDPSCSYGEIAEGATSFGGDVYVFDLTNSPGGAFNVWFDVTYEDACGNPFRVRLDPEFDPTKTERETVPVSSFKLAQNYPNPFNPNTTIGYQVPLRSMVNLSIFDVSGRLVRTLVSDYNEAGLYAAQWDGKDSRGVSVASGIYFYKFQAGSYRETKRMVLLR